MTALFSIASYGFNPHAVPYLISAILVIASGGYVLFRHRAARVRHNFFWLTAVLFVWLASMFFMASAADADVGRLWNRIMYSGVVFIPSMVLVVAVSYFRLKKRWLVRGALATSSVFLILLWLTNLLMESVYPYKWGGFSGVAGPAHPVFLVFFAVISTIALAIYLQQRKRAKTAEESKRILLMFFSYLIAYIGSVDYLQTYHIPVYMFGYAPLMVYAAAHFYAINKLQLFVVEPALEGIKRKPKYSLKEGFSYVVTKNAMNIFIDQVFSGRHGLLVTRTNPDLVVKETPLKRTPMVWITELDGENTIHPTALEEISYTITRFLETAPSGTVLIEGIPHLLHHNSLTAVLHFIEGLRDKVSLRKSSLLIAVEPNVLEEREFRLLLNELEELKV